jgi:hypothetical protein
MARAALAFFLCLALGGAGPFTERLAPAARKHIRTVAVISDLGHAFTFAHVRNTPWQWLVPSDSRLLESSDWALDPYVAKAVSAALARSFVVKPVMFQPADFSTWNDYLLRRAVLDLNADPGIDAYVLILRDCRNDAPGGHALCGLGLYRRDGTPAPALFAAYRIVVVDALTGDTLASRAASLPDGALPSLPVPASLWPKSPDALDAAQSAMLAADETRLIDATLLRTLGELGLAR